MSDSLFESTLLSNDPQRLIDELNRKYPGNPNNKALFLREQRGFSSTKTTTNRKALTSFIVVVLTEILYMDISSCIPHSKNKPILELIMLLGDATLIKYWFKNELVKYYNNHPNFRCTEMVLDAISCHISIFAFTKTAMTRTDGVVLRRLVAKTIGDQTSVQHTENAVLHFLKIEDAQNWGRSLAPLKLAFPKLVQMVIGQMDKDSPIKFCPIKAAERELKAEQVAQHYAQVEKDKTNLIVLKETRIEDVYNKAVLTAKTSKARYEKAQLVYSTAAKSVNANPNSSSLRNKSSAARRAVMSAKLDNDDKQKSVALLSKEYKQANLTLHARRVAISSRR